MITFDKIKITERRHDDGVNKSIHPGDVEITASIRIDRTCYLKNESNKERYVIDGNLKLYLLYDVYGDVINQLRELKFTTLMNCGIGCDSEKIAKGFDAIFNKIYSK